jgi:hypothetical protein
MPALAKIEHHTSVGDRMNASKLLWLILMTALCGCNGIDSPFATRVTLADAEGWVNTSDDSDKQRVGVNIVGDSAVGADPAYLDAYQKFLSSPDPMLRAAALRAVGRNSPIARAEAVTELLTAGRPSRTGRADQWAFREPAFVRWEAAVALQRLHNPDVAIESLISTLGRDPDSDVRRAAAKALGQYADGKVFTALVSALMRDRDHGVVRGCVDSLGLITGERFGDNGAGWLTWEAKQAKPFANRQPYLYPVFRRAPHWWEFFDALFPPDNSPKLPRGYVAAQGA